MGSCLNGILDSGTQFLRWQLIDHSQREIDALRTWTIAFSSS
jgi:hypothetical protein